VVYAQAALGRAQRPEQYTKGTVGNSRLGGEDRASPDLMGAYLHVNCKIIKPKGGAPGR